MTWGRRPLAVGAAALALLVGCSRSDPRLADPAPATGSQTPDRTASPHRPDPAASGLDAARGFRSTRGYRATPVPTRMIIPKIGVASSLDRLGRARDGTVQVPGPDRWEVPGWYELGPRPGDRGSAVILGHVDSTRGPAVFFRLRELRRGDEIEVTRADGSSVRFVVQRTAQYDKQRFPTDDVYYPTLTSALRLVTCGGQFDTSTGHYRSNIIVFATLRT
jgi:sortase (surface protein transpeptidase)